jgi:hypothetical protein
MKAETLPKTPTYRVSELLAQAKKRKGNLRDVKRFKQDLEHIGAVVMLNERLFLKSPTLLGIAMKTLEQIATTPRNAGAKRNASATLTFIESLLSRATTVSKRAARPKAKAR